MRGLAGIRARLDELLSARAVENERPTTVVLLPANGRGPASDVRPYPRVDRVGRSSIIVYRIEDGQPGADEIDRLIEGAA